MINKEILEPAFPRNDSAPGHNGMTLRDYFAAKAMQSLLLADLNTMYPDALVYNDKGQPSVSLSAYAMADAMLEARALIAELQSGRDAAITGEQK